MPRPFMSEEELERLLCYDPRENESQSSAPYTQMSGSTTPPASPFTIAERNRLTGVDPAALAIYQNAVLAWEFAHAAAGQGREDANLGAPDAFAGTAKSFDPGEAGTSGRISSMAQIRKQSLRQS